MEACHFFGEADAPGAVDAPVHVGDNEGTDVFVLHCPLVFVVSACCVPIEVGVVLQIALSALVADGTVQWVVGQQEFHDSASSQSRNLRIRPDLHRWCHLRAARGHGFGRLFDLN